MFDLRRSAGSRERRRKAFDQMFHIVVMALNFWHADYRFPSLSLIARAPSPSQAVLLEKLRRIVKAFGSCDGEFSIYHPVAEDALL